MKKLLVGILSLLSVLSVYAQKGISQPKNFYIAREVKPPVLNIDKQTLAFEDPSGNNAIDANETCKIRFDVNNSGPGDAIGCIAKVTLSGTTDDITAGNIQINTIPSGETVSVDIPVVSGVGTKDGNVVFTIELTEGQGFGTEPIQLAVNTRVFQAPMLIRKAGEACSL